MIQQILKTGSLLKYILAVLLLGLIPFACSDIGLGPDSLLVEMNASVTPSGAGTANPPTGTYERGKEITIEATDEKPADSLQFLGWSGDTTAVENPLVFNINRDMELTAHFGKSELLITASAQPEGSGVVNPDSAIYGFGDQVQLEAVADTGYEFISWSGDTTGISNPLQLTITRDMNLVANFGPKVYSFTSSVEPPTGGIVEPSEGNYEWGTELSVAATPNEGFRFLEWHGDTSSTSNPLNLLMNSDKVLTAVFDKIARPFTNRISVNGGVDTTTITFGMHAKATAGFDQGIDRDLPPPPPSGEFDARFTIPDYGLAEDYRAVREQQTLWTMRLQSAEKDTVSLSWDFSNSAHLGSLILTNNPDNPSFEINMKNRTSYQISGTTKTVLYIISER